MSASKLFWSPMFALAALASLLFSPVAGAEALAAAATNWDGVTLEVASVERKNQVLTVKWLLRNDGAERANVSFNTFDGGAYTAGTYLLDEESGTKYFVLLDEGNKAVAGDLSFYLEGGKTRRLWAKFPGPPPEVDTITLIFDETEPLEEVPITDK